MKPLRTLVSLVFTLGLVSRPLPADAVVGASANGDAHAAAIVMVLQRKGSAAGFCSGIVIGRTSVLTAAHCVPQGADVRIHYRDAEGAPVLLPVTRVLRHPGYRADATKRRERSIDLAVITTAQPLPDRFSAATIGDPGAVTAGTPFRIFGFGVTREDDGKSSGQLREATVVTRAPLSAVLLWTEDPRRQGLGACTGDSGGPVFQADGGAVVALTLWASGTGAAHASWHSSPSRSGVSGASSAGLSTTVQPVASAGPIFQIVALSGPFHGMIAPTTPTGSFRVKLT